jgi:DNA-binding transcriptional ArsR family regulator
MLVSPPSSDALRTAVEPRRLQILEFIWDAERSVTEIADRLPVSMAAVSQHLTKLRAAGLVSVRAEGRHRYYRATKADLGALAVVLESFWADRLDTLKQMAESIEAQSIDREANDPAEVRRNIQSEM